MSSSPPFRVTVYAASSEQIPEKYFHVAEELGRRIAERSWTLVWGGGRYGLMGAVSRGARSAAGGLEGVILRKFVEMDVHCRDTPLMDTVDDMRNRKAGLDLKGDAFIALPGGLGTLEEITEILSFKQLGFHDKPVVFLNASGYWDPMIAMIDRAIDEGFLHARYRGLFSVATSAEEAIEAVATYQSDPATRASKYET